MKTIRIRAAGQFLLLTALLVLPALPVRAETLGDAWRLALDRNNSLAAIRSQADAASAEAGAAQAERWPRLSVDGSYQRFGDAPAFSFPVAGQTFLSPDLVDDDDFYSARVRLEVPVFTAGRVTASIESASLGARAAAAVRDGAVQDLKLAVAVAYVDVLRAGRAVAAASAQVASLDSLVSDIRVMMEQETVAKNDLLAAQVTLANARQGLLRAENRQSLAIAGYNRLLGEPLERVPALDDLPMPPPEAGQSLESLVTRAATNRSELSGLEARANALEQRARSERASGWPQVGLMADYQYLENQVLDREDFTLVGIGFNWTVFDAGRIRQRSDSFASAGRAARHDRDDLRSRIELEVRQVWLDGREARARVQVNREAVEQAEENLRATREQYAVGLANNTVVLDAEALRLTAIRNYDDAVLDSVLAGLRLQRAVGDL